jgi:hypothetical protein
MNRPVKPRIAPLVAEWKVDKHALGDHSLTYRLEVSIRYGIVVVKPCRYQLRCVRRDMRQNVAYRSLGVMNPIDPDRCIALVAFDALSRTEWRLAIEPDKPRMCATLLAHPSQTESLKQVEPTL